MNIKFLVDKKNMDKYGNVSKQLKHEDYRIVFCDNTEIDTDTFFNFIIIDESFIHNNLTINNFIAHFNTIPFIVNIAKENKDHEIYKMENFLGYIDLLSAFPILKSHLFHLSKNIEHYNQKHRTNNIRSHFSRIDLHFFLTFSNGLIFSNKEGDILDINYAARKILDTNESNIPKFSYIETSWNFINEYGIPYNKDNSVIEYVCKTKQSVKGIIVGITTLSGIFKWIKIDVVPVLDLDNNISVIYYHLVDITKIKQEEEELHLLSAAVLYSPISIAITNTYGIITAINPKFCNLTGYSKKELLGNNVSMLKHDKSKTDYKKLWDTISKGEIWHGEFYNKHKDGTFYTEATIIAPVKNKQGKITHYIALKEDITDLRSTQEKLEYTLSNMEELVSLKTSELKDAQQITLESMAVLSEFRDNETGLHIKRTKNYRKFIIESLKIKLNISDDDACSIWMAAPLHDIGKVAIPDRILLKSGKLTSEEFEEMKKHTTYGHDALSKVSMNNKNSDYLKYSKEISLNHHEKWDGTGYPNGLKGEEIPFSARAMTIADVYDALRSVRPYKKSFSHSRTIDIMKDLSGKDFDPALIDFLLENENEFDNIFKQIS